MDGAVWKESRINHSVKCELGFAPQLSLTSVLDLVGSSGSSCMPGFDTML